VLPLATLFLLAEKLKQHHMKKIYWHTEKIFEKLTSVIIAVLGNSITFILVLLTVIFWLSNSLLYSQDVHERIRDLFIGVTFLTLFIIQKAFNRFSALLHLKVNELVASHEPASNSVMNAGEKQNTRSMNFQKDMQNSRNRQMPNWLKTLTRLAENK
jgi:low affinity Fe/Cu permease